MLPAFNVVGCVFGRAGHGDNLIRGGTIDRFTDAVKLFHLFSGVRQRPVVRGNQGFRIPVQPEQAAVLPQGGDVLRSEDRAAAGGDDLSALF